MSHLKEVVGYKRPTKLACPTCGGPLQVNETRFEYRMRICGNKHKHYTFQDTFTTETNFVMARAMRDRRMWLVKPRPLVPKKIRRIDLLISLPKIRTGHYVEETDKGRIYRMPMSVL